MNPVIKNILIFVVVGGILASVYFFVIKKPAGEDANLVSSTGASALPVATPITSPVAPTASDSSLFLSVLLNVKNIKLNDGIFADPAFAKLRDSSIELVPDGNEGRPNPFAPIGSDLSNFPITSEVLVIPDAIAPEVLDQGIIEQTPAPTN